MDYDELLKMLMKRRSVRDFKPDSIPDEYVDKIIEAARWAPSGANSQPWEFVVVKKKELRDKIVDIITESMTVSKRMELTREEEMRHPGPAHRSYGERPGYADAPVFILLLGDSRLNAAYTVSAIYFQGSQHFASGLANAFLYMHLAAASLGLGSQWVSSTNHPIPQVLIKQLLSIPEELTIYDMMPVGYPSPMPPELKRVRTRRQAEEMLHRDLYDMSKYRTPKDIRAFIMKVHGVERSP
jgi:5,6-dimethylbenzimidazole synthase